MKINKFLNDLMSYNGTDLMCYNLEFLDKILKSIKNDFNNIKILYAMKANSNNVILDIIKKNGIGIDCASYNEYILAKRKKFKYISCTGPGFTVEEISKIISSNDFFDFDNIEQLKKYKKLNTLNFKRLGIRLAYNGSHLGINLEEILDNLELFVNLERLHIHYGYKTLKNLEECLEYIFKIILNFKHIFNNINQINLGGSFEGIYLRKEKVQVLELINSFKIKLKENFGLNIEVIIEPGDLIVRTIGFYKSKIIYFGENKIILNSSTLNFSPWYSKRLFYSNLFNEKGVNEINVVGNSCFENDVFGKIEIEKEKNKKDSIIIYPVGAYNFNMNKFIHDRKNKMKILYFERGIFFEK